MSLPLVAVITRTRNRPVLLARAIESVRRQRFEDWVHVIVNDGGDRAHLDALPSHPKTKVIHLAGVGRGRAANQGLAASDSTLVVCHDDDDTWHPDFLSTAVASWKSSGRRGVVTLSERVIEVFEGERVVELRREPFFPRLTALSLADLARESCVVNLAFLAERSAVNEVGGYDETLPLYEDWDFSLRFLSRFDVAVVPRVLAHYHHRVGAQGDQRNSFQQEEGRVADARAVLLNRWLRDPERRHVGLLMALGPGLTTLEAMSIRVDKLFNFVHGARQNWLLRNVESWLKPRG